MSSCGRLRGRVVPRRRLMTRSHWRRDSLISRHLVVQFFTNVIYIYVYMHPFASLVLLLLLIRLDLGLLLDHQSGVNKKKRNQLNEKWLRTTIGLVFIPQKFTQRTIEISLLRTNSSKERAKTHNATLWNHNAVLAKTLTAHWLIMTSFFVHSQ